MPTQELLRACLESMRSKSFYPAYQKTFRVIRAESDELREIAFRLRYQVYCEEHGMDADDVSSGSALIERDSYDDHAIHYLLYHKMTDKVVGTARIILPRNDKVLHSFPLQSICDHHLLHIEERARKFCELSRLCMVREFRRRPEDGKKIPGYSDQDQIIRVENGVTIHVRRSIPFAPLGLLSAAFESALDCGLTDCVSVLDPEQLCAFQKIGLPCHMLGPKIDTNIPQHPVIFNIKHALDNMILQNPPCWEVVSDRGRLHLKANGAEQDSQDDDILDRESMDLIFCHLST